MYKAFKLDLSHAQAMKVLEGKPVRLRAEQLGKGVSHMLHPANYKKLMSAKKAGKGVVLDMTHGEVLASHQGSIEGAGFWGDVWNGAKKAFKFAKSSGILSRLLDVGVPAAATYLGQPTAGAPVRAGIKKLTGLGIAEQQPVEGEGIKLADVKRHGKKALKYAKDTGLLTAGLDAGERFLLSKTKDEMHHSMIKGARKAIRTKYGVGLVGGSFRLN